MMYILILIPVLLLSSGYYFMRVTFYPTVLSYEKLLEDERERGIIEPEVFRAYDQRKVSIKTNNGYSLNGIWMPAKDLKKTVIIVHGYTNNLNGSIRYTSIFKELGYNVLIYDQRFHGKSGGKNCTFGYYEKLDLSAVIDWVEHTVGSGTEIGLHGESMGASTVLMHCAIDDRAAFAVADCAYSDLRLQFGNRLKEDFHLPSFPVLTFSNMVTRLLTGISYNMVSPIRDLEKVTTPVCFIHGKEDRFTDSVQSVEMYKKKKGKKKLYLVEGANHAQSILVNPSIYKEVVHQFIESLEENNKKRGTDNE